MDKVDCVIIGAGVVGLACARTLAVAGYEVIVLEANAAIGMETSSRNSEVVHSGIYYPRKSLKASACVRGKDLLYAYCDKHHISHQKIGKLIVATTVSELEILNNIHAKGTENGVLDLEILSQKQALRKEPALKCEGALWSPSTGIVDSHSLMLAFQGELEEQGGVIAFNTPVLSSKIVNDGVILDTGGAEPFRLKSNFLINCAGLNAQSVASQVVGYPIATLPKRYLAKGVYFSLKGKSPFKHLVYPSPEPGGLGIHATLDLAGQCRFGPDVEWVDQIDYHVDVLRAQNFYDLIRKYWPALPDDSLIPAYSGIRPKIVPQGKPAGDFIIEGPAEHNSGNVIHLFGIESPGLTSSLALAENVQNIIELAK